MEDAGNVQIRVTYPGKIVESKSIEGLTETNDASKSYATDPPSYAYNHSDPNPTLSTRLFFIGKEDDAKYEIIFYTTKASDRTYTHSVQWFNKVDLVSREFSIDDIRRMTFTLSFFDSVTGDSKSFPEFKAAYDALYSAHKSFGGRSKTGETTVGHLRAVAKHVGLVGGSKLRKDELQKAVNTKLARKRR